jgi:proteasome lid subunit RPN8/RPN11
MMTDYFAQIAAQAEASPAREICGFLLLDGKGSLEAVEVPNVSSDPEKWQIHPSKYLENKNTGRLIATYHSHWSSSEQPTAADLKSSNVSDLPMFIYSTQTKNFSFYRSMASMNPFENRMFICGIQDCVSLAVDYYQVNWGVKLPFVVRTPAVIESGFPNIHSLVKDLMEKVSPSSIKKDDLLTFAISSPNGVENHVAIYLGDGRILHQLQGRESCVQNLSESWQKRVVNALRLR